MEHHDVGDLIQYSGLEKLDVVSSKGFRYTEDGLSARYRSSAGDEIIISIQPGIGKWFYDVKSVSKAMKGDEANNAVRDIQVLLSVFEIPFQLEYGGKKLLPIDTNHVRVIRGQNVRSL
jgi:hypothetical protein